MKKIFFTLLAMPLFFACAPADSYKISGEYANAPEGSKVYLAELTHESINYIDSADVENGHFEMSGAQEIPAVRFLFYKLNSGGDDIVPMVLENGNIRVKIENGAIVSGTELNNAIQAYKNEFDAVTSSAEAIYRAARTPEYATPEKRDSLQAETDNIVKRLSETIITHIRKNIENPIGSFLISTSGQMCDPEAIYNIVDSVPEIYRDKRFKRFCEQFKQDMITKDGAMRTSEGGAYINFELNDINGNKTLFSDIVDNNKYTILDFWASWCGPCRKEMPTMKAIYEKHGKKGLAVVSLSLDTDAEAWKKSVAELGMTWTQLCNPDGGSREVGQAYGVEFIPTVLIIDKDGLIVSRGLTGKGLADKIDELMK